MGEMLVVRWPQHSAELLQSLTAMRDLGELLDVTLVTPDGEAEAHRVVLAASSELLRAMLKKTSTTYGPCSLMLRDLSIGQLELALDFIYRGELAVDKAQFDLLARACDYLQIKASLASEEGVTVVDQRVFEDEEPEIVPYHAVPVNQSGRVTGGKRRMSHVVAQEAQQIEHIDPHTLAVPDDFQVIELVEETRPSSSGATGGYSTRRNRQEYAKRARLTTVGDKKIFSLDQQPTPRSADEKPAKRFCRECSLMFSYLSDYKEHRRQMHSLQCNHCSFRATKSSAVRDHFEKVHQNVRRFSCSECTFQCKDRATLYNHIRRHTNEKPYECAYCDYKAAQSASMKQHVALHENIESRPHRCDECTRHPISFASRSALTKHKKAHHNGGKGRKQQSMLMNLEIIKDDAGNERSKTQRIVPKNDSGPAISTAHVDVEQERIIGSPSVSRQTACGAHAPLVDSTGDSHRGIRVEEGNTEELHDNDMEHHAQEEIEAGEKHNANVDAEVHDEATTRMTTVVGGSVSASAEPPDEEDRDDEEDEEDEIGDEEDDDEENAEEEEEPAAATASVASGIPERPAGSLRTERVTTDQQILRRRESAAQVAMTPITVNTRIPEGLSKVHIAISTTTTTAGHIESLSATAGPENADLHQQHHPHQSEHQHHHPLHQHQVSAGDGDNTSDRQMTVHSITEQPTVGGDSMVHHPGSVIGEGSLVAGVGTSDSLSESANIAGVAIVVGNHDNASGNTDQHQIRGSGQHDIEAHTGIGPAVDNRVVLTAAATIPAHVVRGIVTSTVTTSTTMGGSLGTMEIADSTMGHHTRSSDNRTDVSSVVIGGATQMNSTTKGATVGSHIVAVHGPDSMQLHPMM